MQPSPDPRAFLLAYLAHGPRPLSEIGRAARAIGVTPEDLRRASTALGITITQSSVCPIWSLPADAR